MSVPITRTLPYVLRGQINEPRGVSFLIGKVISTPDSKHVRIEIGGAQITVPKLASYSAPVANEPCYVLTAGEVTIALGTCK